VIRGGRGKKVPLKALFAFLGTLAAVTATVGLAAPAHPNLSALKYRFIGPDGNRAIAVVGEPGNPNVAYIGAASEAASRPPTAA
jgi:hypothetical protein